MQFLKIPPNNGAFPLVIGLGVFAAVSATSRGSRSQSKVWKAHVGFGRDRIVITNIPAGTAQDAGEAALQVAQTVPGWPTGQWVRDQDEQNLSDYEVLQVVPHGSNLTRVGDEGRHPVSWSSVSF